MFKLCSKRPPDANVAVFGAMCKQSNLEDDVPPPLKGVAPVLLLKKFVVMRFNFTTNRVMVFNNSKWIL